MAYATVADVEARYPGVTTGRVERTEVLLDDAAVIIDGEAPLSRTPTAHDLAVRTVVSCSVVRRALVSPVDQQAMVQVQRTVGPFSVGGTLADPDSGGLYLSQADRRRLGLLRQRAGSVDLTRRPRR